jgi:aerobic C4-dicarboxylate transport protein
MIVAAIDAAAPSPPWYRQLYVQVIAAIAAGILLGYFRPETGQDMKPLGDAFIRLVKMIIAPVIFLTVATGIAGMRDLGSVGRVAARTFAYFLFFSVLALLVGLAVANLLRPGDGLAISPSALDARSVAPYASAAHGEDAASFFASVIPETFPSAIVGGNILQTLFVAVLFGVALALIGSRGERLLGLLEELSLVMFRLIAILMKAAPVGAFGAMAFTVGEYGIAALANLAALVACFYLAAFLFIFFVLGTVLRRIGISMVRLIIYLRAELLLVVGTSSSESALPGLMEKMERAGCAKSVVGLVVLTGYSFNLDGTNIYMAFAALFIAQACGIDLSLGEQAQLLGVAMLSSKGAAGVTGAGFITLAATLSIVPSIPVAGMALILGVDRFMSECRSVTNFIGNAVAAIAISRWEGQLDHARCKAVLDGTAVPDLPPSRGLPGPLPLTSRLRRRPS